MILTLDENEVIMDTSDAQPSSSPVVYPQSHVVCPSYSDMQNRERAWSTAVEGFEVPPFERPLKVNKDYTNRRDGQI